VILTISSSIWIDQFLCVDRAFCVVGVSLGFLELYESVELLSQVRKVSLYLCVCVCVYVCVWERERERAYQFDVLYVIALFPVENGNLVIFDESYLMCMTNLIFMILMILSCSSLLVDFCVDWEN